MNTVYYFAEELKKVGMWPRILDILPWADKIAMIACVSDSDIHREILAAQRGYFHGLRASVKEKI